MDTRYIFSLFLAFLAFAARQKGGIVAWRMHPNKTQYDTAFKLASEKYHIPKDLLARIAYQESRFNSQAKSPAGALGLMQFMPATAAEMGINPLNPFEAIDGAAKYISKLRSQTGSWKMALAAYNWGIGNLRRKGFEKAPLETVNYVTQISKDTGLV